MILLRLVLAALLVLGTVPATQAHAQGSIISRPATSCAADYLARVGTPITGQSPCYDATLNIWTGYDGTGWLSDAALALNVIVASDPKFAVGTDTQRLQAAATAASGKTALILNASYSVSDSITLPSNIYVMGVAGATLTQTGTDKGTLVANHQSNVWIDGVKLVGLGNYNPAITSMSQNGDRGIRFIVCTFCGVSRTHIVQEASVGIEVNGGTSIWLTRNRIEGTTGYTLPAVTTNNNWQVGLWMNQTSANGVITDLVVDGLEVSGTAQGVVLGREADVAVGGKNRAFSNIVCHDIPGQHCLYFGDGEYTVIGLTCDTIALNCSKTQVNDGFTIENITVVNISAANLASDSIASVTAPQKGVIQGVRLSGVGHDVLRGVSIGGVGSSHIATNAGNVTITDTAGDTVWKAGDVGRTVVVYGAGVAGADLTTTIAVFNAPNSVDLTVAPSATITTTLVYADTGVHDITADFTVSDVTQHGAVVQGYDVENLDLHIQVNRAGRYGVLLAPRSSTNLRVQASIINPGTVPAGGPYDGIGIQSPTVSVDLINPYIVDGAGNMGNGLFSTKTLTAGYAIRVLGSLTSTGATAYGVRTASAFSAFPKDFTVTGTTAAFHDVTLLGKTYTSGAAAGATDGGTITHSLGTTPTSCTASGSVGSQFVSVTALGATTFTAAIKKDTGAAGDAQTVYWRCER